jgi:hypothetical protein
VFVPRKPFRSSLIFVREARAYLSKTLFSAHLWSTLLALYTKALASQEETLQLILSLNQ